MGLRPGHCYSSSVKNRAYTRSAVTVHRKNYIGAIPHLKTRQFNMGNPIKDFTHILDLIVDDSGWQIRDNAIEASRIAINRYLNRKLGKDGYFMKIRVYPYHILRENKQAQGAGADRVSKGMSLSFGKPIGRAARVRIGQKIISVLVDEKDLVLAKEALLRARSKMNVELKVRVGTDVKSIGTKPRKITEEAVEVKAEEKKEEGAEAVAGEGEAKEGEKKAEGKEGAGGAKGKEASAKGKDASKATGKTDKAAEKKK
ncbi:MAG: 50S ribosomal protein L16 [Candidatus Diapherotrites archaeon]